MKLLTVPAVLACALLLAPSQTLAQVVQEEVEAPRSIVELRPASPVSESLALGSAPEIQSAESLGERRRSPWLLPGIGAAVGAGVYTSAYVVGCARIGGGCSPVFIPLVVVTGGALGGALGLAAEAVLRRIERRER